MNTLPINAPLASVMPVSDEAQLPPNSYSSSSSESEDEFEILNRKDKMDLIKIIMEDRKAQNALKVKEMNEMQSLIKDLVELGQREKEVQKDMEEINKAVVMNAELLKEISQESTMRKEAIKEMIKESSKEFDKLKDLINNYPSNPRAIGSCRS